MEELLRIEKCLQTLQDAPSAPVQPLDYSEFLIIVQEFKKDVTDQLNRVRAFNFKARQLKESMRQEIPNILKLCYENPANDTVGDRHRIDPDAHPGTPVMLTPRPPRKRVILNTGITTPRRNTPLSLSKSLLQHKFSARGSPAAFSKLQFRGTPVKTGKQAPLECTPQMPRSTSKRKQAGTVTPVSTQSKERGGVEAAKLPGPNSSEVKIREKTPEMKERVSFFLNPNVANIHRRYVAIQDQDADESTCLLSARCGPKTSSTPEFPMSSQKEPQMRTPAQRGEVTPPLPMSSTKKAVKSSTTPPIESRPGKKSDFDRTPSPPKSAPSRVRRCLVESNGSEHRPETLRTRQPQALTQPLSTISISVKQTPASRTLFETLSLKSTKTIRTPQFPIPGRKRTQMQTPAQRSEVTPPLPISTTKKAVHPSTTPPIEPKVDKHSEFDRTPSPPKSAASRVRRCLETKITSSQIACDALRSVDANGVEHRPEILRKRESQTFTQPLSKISISVNQTPASTTLFETPSLKSQNKSTSAGAKANLLQNSVLRDNQNSLRKKRLLSNLEKTPCIPKTGKVKATSKSRTPAGRAATMPLNMENMTLPLRPSKMLRNKTIAP